MSQSIAHNNCTTKRCSQNTECAFIYYSWDFEYLIYNLSFERIKAEAQVGFLKGSERPSPSPAF